MTRLEAARRAARLTQTRLAARVHLHPSDISRFERGWAKPFPKQAARLAKALGLTSDELLESSPIPSSAVVSGRH